MTCKDCRDEVEQGSYCEFCLSDCELVPGGDKAAFICNKCNHPTAFGHTCKSCYIKVLKGVINEQGIQGDHMTPAEELAGSKSVPKVVGGHNHREKVWVCRLKEKRKALRLTLEEVAKATGASHTNIHFIEAGVDPRLTVAIKLADFFGVTVYDLWPELKDKT